jgi:hypothetical protein
VAAPPKILDEIDTMLGDELVAALWDMLVAAKHRGSQKDLRGRLDLNEPLSILYGTSMDASVLSRNRRRQRLLDAFGTLVERGFIWFNRWAEGSAAGSYEFTVKGLAATRDMVLSGWPDGRSVRDRIQQAEDEKWDNTLLAYYRMALTTYEAGVFEPALFLIGGAAERLVWLIADRLDPRLPQNWAKKKPGELIELLAKHLRESDELNAGELLLVVGHTARLSRNEIGHPKAIPPDVPREVVLTRLAEFPEVVKRLTAAVDRIIAGP